MAVLIRVTAAIIVHGGRVLIAQRGRTDPMAGFWEFPGGKIESGETPEACLRRELLEELEMGVDIGRFLGKNFHHEVQRTIELLAFQAFWDGRPFRPVEHQACRWVPPGSLPEYSFTPADRPFVQRLSDGDLLRDLF